MNRKIQIVFADPYLGIDSFSQELKENNNSRIISLNTIIRAELNSDSELGNLLKKQLDSGEIVSDEVIIKLLKKEINKDSLNIILQKFPRIPKHLTLIKEVLSELKIEIDNVWYLKLVNIEFALNSELSGLVIHAKKVGLTSENMLLNLTKQKDLYKNTIDILSNEFKLKTIEIDLEKHINLSEYYKQIATIPNNI
ncbi:nucleoside monophosphate kinase [Tenacibaculum geojense]|uniref:Nucleoside monophosphate kinase n=1 Tax=Tenacibaculum geojense TaxID=915352 RepID=A0ABW3JUR6_9FLAO